MSIMITMSISLAATLALEFIYTKALRYNINIPLLLAANLLTNPSVNALYYIISSESGLNQWLIKLPLELAAVTAEYFIYKKYSDVKNPLAYAAGVNAFSFFIGYFINTIINQF